MNMKHKLLRSYMHRPYLSLRKNGILKNCELVIDGKSYFNAMYKKSGSQYILGGEYDRFAHYLKSILSNFVMSNVTCHVVFNAGVDAGIERRTKGFQTKLDLADSVTPTTVQNTFCEPLFMFDVIKQVLNELNISYFVSEYDATEAMLHMAKKLRCAIVTNNLQFSIYGVDTVEINSLRFDNEKKHIECTEFCSRMCNRFMPRADEAKKAIFMALVEEYGSHFSKVLEVFGHEKVTPVPSILRWVKNERNSDVLLFKISQILTSDEEREEFLTLYEANAKLFKKPPYDALAVRYVKDKTRFGILKRHENWMARGVACGRIGTTYVNLKNKDVFTGTWQIVNMTQDEAMLPAMDIVFYVHGILNNTNTGTITFIGRKFDKAVVWEMPYKLDMHIDHDSLFRKSANLFRQFVNYHLPGFKFSILEKAEKSCWIILITLVYYCKRNKDFEIAKSVLLSYVMLEPVADKCGVIKRSNIMNKLECRDTEGDDDDFSLEKCVFIADALMHLFYVENITSDFDRSILHSLVEFQICLQHINNLNRLCGESIPCSVYHKSINVTFIYNVYRTMKQDIRKPMKYFERRLENSPIFGYFKSLNLTFEELFASVQ